MGSRPTGYIPTLTDTSEFNQQTAEDTMVDLKSKLENSEKHTGETETQLLENYTDQELANDLELIFEGLYPDQAGQDIWGSVYQTGTDTAVLLFDTLTELGKRGWDITYGVGKEVGETGYTLWSKLYNGLKQTVENNWFQ